MTAIVGVDQGTSSTKAMLLDGDGQVRARATVPVGRTHTRPGWVQQDPGELWDSVRNAIAQLPVSDDATLLGLSSQRESVLVWDRRTGRPLTPCVSWQCTRGAEICRELAAAGADSRVRALTGLPLDPMFSASKLRHLLDAEPALRAAAQAGEACAGTVDSWLLWRLTGGRLHVSDLGSASRTLLLDLARREWSEELLELFAIPRACLPRVIESGGPIGEVTAEGLPPMTIAASLADSHAAAYGLGCVGPGQVKATYGTGTSLLAPTGPTASASDHGLAATIAWSLGGPTTYALEGNVFSSGATVGWLASVLRLDGPEALERLAAEASDAGGVYIVPAFAGLGAPYWRPEARGAIVGLSFATGPAQLACAALDSIALQVADLVAALESDTEEPLAELRVDGGASRNDGLMQRQADLLGCPVVRLDDTSAAARGAGLMAARAAGGTAAPVADAARRSTTRFEPRLSEPARAEQLAGWHDAVARSLTQREAVTV